MGTCVVSLDEVNHDDNDVKMEKKNNNQTANSVLCLEK